MNRWIPVLVYVVALAGFTLGAARGIDRGPFDRVAVGSERGAWELTLRLSQGESDAASLGSLGAPLYPRFLMPVVSDKAGAVRDARRKLVFLVLPTLSLLVFGLLRGRTRPWSAVVGGLAVAAAGPVVLTAGSFEPAVPAALLSLLALLLLDGRPGWVPWVLAGILVGLASRFHILLGWSMGLSLLTLAAVRPGGSPRGLAMAALAISWILGAWGGGVLGKSDQTLPWISGVAMYEGHRPQASGVNPRRGDTDADGWRSGMEYRVIAIQETGHRVSQAEMNRYWARQGLLGAVTRPDREILRTGVKTASLLQGDPVPQDLGPNFMLTLTDGPGLSLFLWLGRILIPLGVAGLLVSWRRMGPVWWVGIASGALAFALTYAQPGARLITVCLLAGGTAFLVEALLERPTRIRAGFLALVGVGLLGVLPWARPLPGTAVASMDHYLLGGLYDQEGRGTAAMREYDRALGLDETNPYPRLAIAEMLARDQVYEEAITELEALREINPDSLPALMALGRLYQSRERWRETIVIYEELARLDNTNPEHKNNLGTAFLVAGYFQRAEASFMEALALDPNYAAARDNLSQMKERGFAFEGDAAEEASAEQVVVLLREQRYEEAESALARAFAVHGEDDLQLRFVQGTLFLQTGRLAQAIETLEALAPQMASSAIFGHNLAAAYAQGGRAREALELWSLLSRQAPGNQMFIQSLARVRGQLQAEAAVAEAAGQKDEAVAIWESLVKFTPGNPAFADSLEAVRSR